MRSSFIRKCPNTVYEEPVLYVKPKFLKEAFLFDTGNLMHFRPKEIIRSQYIFITHFHMDHFQDFDTVIRTCLPFKITIHVYGPKGCIEKVYNRIASYTWNLAGSYDLTIEAHEVSGATIQQARFRAKNYFRMEKLARRRMKEHMLIESKRFRVVCRELEHDVPVLGYSIIEKNRFNVNKSFLTENKLKPGKWISLIKERIIAASDQTDLKKGGPFPVNIDDIVKELNHGREKKLSPRRMIDNMIIKNRGEKITYITDITPTKENIKKACDLAVNSDFLYIESMFEDTEKERALERNHLYEKAALMIVKRSRSRNHIFIHKSPLYKPRR
ncbi:hypothetical protein ACFL6D_01750 [Spirochaetota bacterium]